MKNFLLFAFGSLLFLITGCATKEATQDFDFVVGSNYQAPLNLRSNLHPRRILLLPVTGPVQPDYKSVFLNEFLATSNQGTGFQVIPSGDQMISSTDLTLKSSDAKNKALRSHCDAILHLSLKNSSVYPPIRATVEVQLVDAKSDALIADGSFDYDTQNELVANAARRYYQNRLQRVDAPQKSMSILENNHLFLKYVGFDSCKTITTSLTATPSEIKNN